MIQILRILNTNCIRQGLESVLERKKKEMESLLETTLMEFAQFMDPHQDVFYELFRLCKIAVVLPVSSASCERSFSTHRIIKLLVVYYDREEIIKLGCTQIKLSRRDSEGWARN